jgi:colanic acid biosynthesis glycosyl transferase WcaI
MFEAMACEKPLVLAVAGEAEEVVREAGSGICVPPGDHAALRSAIMAFMNNTVLMREMGSRGREHVLKHFSRDCRAQELNKVLTDLIHSSHLQLETRSKDVLGRLGTLWRELST